MNLIFKYSSDILSENTLTKMLQNTVNKDYRKSGGFLLGKSEGYNLLKLLIHMASPTQVKKSSKQKEKTRNLSGRIERTVFRFRESHLMTLHIQPLFYSFHSFYSYNSPLEDRRGKIKFACLY